LKKATPDTYIYVFQLRINYNIVIYLHPSNTIEQCGAWLIYAWMMDIENPVGLDHLLGLFSESVKYITNGIRPIMPPPKSELRI